MRFTVLLLSALLALPAAAQPKVLRFRQWIAGQEAGGAEQRVEVQGADTLLSAREWQRIERMGMVVEQTVEHHYRRRADGSLDISWSLLLAQEPMKGKAAWSSKAPTRLELRPERGEAKTVEIPANTVLWPLDQEARLKEAARLRQQVSIPGYSLPTQQASELLLSPEAPEALPGFPDAIRFRGHGKADGMSFKVTSWISPTEGELKVETVVAGLSLLLQRAELPAPKPGGGPGIFAQTLKALPAHPLLPWMPGARLRWTGAEALELPTTPHQRYLPDGSLELKRATPPTAAEAAQPPVKGKPGAEEAPFLAATPLVDYKDPVFEGLLARLNPPVGASRWELTRRITRFVYDWIDPKDFTVGFASAQETARTARGDCTEHGVLAVALLRRLGVPSRGATGWVALEGTLGLHFWVEVKLRDRWVPVDPTFDEAPATVLHIQLGSSDLADLGSLGWEQAALDLAKGGWAASGDWLAGLQSLGEALAFPGGNLRIKGGRWILDGGHLSLKLEGATAQVEAVARPMSAELRKARALQDAQTGLKGWVSGTRFWVALPGNRWLRLSGLPEGDAHRVLALLSLEDAP